MGIPVLFIENNSIHYQNLTFTTQVCRNMSWLRQGLPETRWKKLTKWFPKCLDSTNPLSDGLVESETIQYHFITSSGMVNQPRSHLIARHVIFQEIANKPSICITSKELEASFALMMISIHETTIKRTTSSNCMPGRIERKLPVLSKENIAAQL